jgi:hypothetical protein
MTSRRPNQVPLVSVVLVAGLVAWGAYSMGRNAGEAEASERALASVRETLKYVHLDGFCDGAYAIGFRAGHTQHGLEYLDIKEAMYEGIIRHGQQVIPDAVTDDKSHQVASDICERGIPGAVLIERTEDELDSLQR